jgi:mannose-6-phosphate isomerase-like protein (cupin superfamily)
MTIEPATRTFTVDIVAAARANVLFRRVLTTGPRAQVVLMSIPPGGEIGEEVHETIDQVFTFVEGIGVAIVDGIEDPPEPNRPLLVAAGSRHNVINRGVGDLRLYTVYAPPQHAREPGRCAGHAGAS